MRLFPAHKISEVKNVSLRPLGTFHNFYDTAHFRFHGHMYKSNEDPVMKLLK